jgi:hypothetical protein
MQVSEVHPQHLRETPYASDDGPGQQKSVFNSARKRGLSMICEAVLMAIFFPHIKPYFRNMIMFVRFEVFTAVTVKNGVF